MNTLKTFMIVNIIGFTLSGGYCAEEDNAVEGIVFNPQTGIKPFSNTDRLNDIHQDTNAPLILIEDAFAQPDEDE